MSKKYHKGYLLADERPLFPPVHSVHLSKKDKEKLRNNIKKQIENEFLNY